VVGRPWNGREYGPGGNTVCLTTAAVDKPVRPVDDEGDRRLMENGWIKERQPPWRVKHPPQKTARAVCVHVILTLLMCAWATAYRLQWAQDAMGQEPVGWRRWRRQLLDQTREQVRVCAQGGSGIFPMAAYALLVGGNIHDRPPGLGTRQHILAKHGITAHG
jgi:hypothetical protein